MRFPAYGRALWERRLAGERPRVVCLLVGDRWRRPKWIPGEIPRLAVKTAPWHLAGQLAVNVPFAQKEQARHAVRAAIAAGTLIREPCEICGHRDSEAHHRSYHASRFFAVNWLCRIHHTAAHALERRARAEEDLDWRVVTAMTVLAIDVRSEAERQQGGDGWDAWLWLLADVQKFARDVHMFTSTIEFQDPKKHLAFERDLGIYAYLNSHIDPATDDRGWPPWWPYGDLQQARAA